MQPAIFFPVALGPHPQRVLTPTPRLGFTCPRLGVAAGAAATLAAFLLFGPFVNQAFAQDTHLVVITGVGGDEEHTKTFHKWATAIIDAAKKKASLPDEDVTYLSEKPDLDASRIKGRSTRETVEKTLADLAVRARPNDTVVILLIGHGSFDGRQAAFNLPGPDLTPADI